MDRKQVVDELTKREVTKPCHRCGNLSFSVIDGYSLLSLQDELSGTIVIGGPSVPVALVACDRCGAITPHALGALGLLPDKSGKAEGKTDG